MCFRECFMHHHGNCTIRLVGFVHLSPNFICQTVESRFLKCLWIDQTPSIIPKHFIVPLTKKNKIFLTFSLSNFSPFEILGVDCTLSRKNSNLTEGSNVSCTHNKFKFYEFLNYVLVLQIARLFVLAQIVVINILGFF